jgi:hypothetical protein
MEFRWVAIITLWTMLTGPIFVAPPASPRAARQQTAVVAAPAPAPPTTP